MPRIASADYRPLLATRRRVPERAHRAVRQRVHDLLLTRPTMSELWMFMQERKKFWLLPIVIHLVMFGGLVLTQG